MFFNTRYTLWYDCNNNAKNGIIKKINIINIFCLFFPLRLIHGSTYTRVYTVEVLFWLKKAYPTKPTKLLRFPLRFARSLRSRTKLVGGKVGRSLSFLQGNVMSICQQSSAYNEGYDNKRNGTILAKYLNNTLLFITLFCYTQTVSVVCQFIV